MNHTKGKWKVFNHNRKPYAITRGSEDICHFEEDDTITTKEMRANAKLIASAPKLLEACIKAEKHHQGGHSGIGHLLRNVIKKATNGLPDK